MVPSTETILGRELARDGSAGIIVFRPMQEKGIEITKLSLAGEGTSHPATPCQVDVAAEGAIHTRFGGRPNGVSRYEVDIPACPFSLEVLDGAVLLTAVPGHVSSQKKIAGEQAGLSSAREMTCRTYLKEDVHGYCALRLAQARALALQAAFMEQAKTKADNPAEALEKRHDSQTETGSKFEDQHESWTPSGT